MKRKNKKNIKNKKEKSSLKKFNIFNKVYFTLWFAWMAWSLIQEMFIKKHPDPVQVFLFTALAIGVIATLIVTAVIKRMTKSYDVLLSSVGHGLKRRAGYLTGEDYQNLFLFGNICGDRKLTPINNQLSSYDIVKPILQPHPIKKDKAIVSYRFKTKEEEIS